MTGVLDYALKFMNELCTEGEPVMFERDGHLIITTNEGYARVSGLKDSKNKGTDAIVKWLGDKTPVLSDDEKEYFNTIMYKDTLDSNTLKANTLRGMIKLHKELIKLGDDDKIRIINHYEGVMTSARVMPVSEYLKSLRDNEKETIDYIRRLPDIYKDKKKHDLKYSIANIVMPQCTIMLPNVAISAPRAVKVLKGYEEEEWTIDSYITSIDYDYTDFNFGLHYNFNLHNSVGREAKDLDLMINSVVGSLFEALKKSRECMNELSDCVTILNEAVKEVKDLRY